MITLLDNHPPLYDRLLAMVLDETTLPKDGGLKKSIVLTRVEFWLSKKEHFHDGRYWVFNSTKSWAEELGLPESTLRRVFKQLRDDGILLTGNYNRQRHDRTLWYSIDYERLAVLIRQYIANHSTDANTCICSSLTDALVQYEQLHLLTVSGAIPLVDFNLDITQQDYGAKKKGLQNADVIRDKITDACRENGLNAQERDEVFAILNRFFKTYYSHFKRRHPVPTDKSLLRAVASLQRQTDFFECEIPLDIEVYEELIERYFNSDYQDGCDYHLQHFCSGDIIRNLYASCGFP